MDYVGRRPAAKSHTQAAITLSALMAEGFPDVPAQRWLEEVETFYDAGPDGLDLRYDPRLRDALITQAESGPAPDLWPLFTALSGLPCGAVRGSNSDLLSAETFAAMQDRLPALQAAEVPDRGHVPFLDEPEALDLIHSVLEQAS
jgi:pimeloyl-ACP methyl ester carboxylesterase